MVSAIVLQLCLLIMAAAVVVRVSSWDREGIDRTLEIDKQQDGPTLDMLLADDPESMWFRTEVRAVTIGLTMCAALFGLLVLGIFLPIHLSPTSALLIGSIGLLPFAGGVLSNIGFGTAVSRYAHLEDALSKVLSVNHKLLGLSTPPSDDRAILRVCQEKLADGLARVDLYPDVRAEELVPNLPLSSDQMQRLEQMLTRDIPVGLLRKRTVGAAWLGSFVLMASTSAFMLVWSQAPATCSASATTCPGAFQGLSDAPRLGDFIYLALNSLVANLPADIVARSPTAHFVFACSVVGGIGVLAITGSVLWRAARTQLRPASASPVGYRSNDAA